MEKFLKYIRHGFHFLAGFVATVVLIAFASEAYATAYSSKPFTGYAMGNLTGANGSTQLIRGHFANHAAGGAYTYDPARNWTWGTQISSINPSISMIMSNGSTSTFTSLFLYDNGDPGCTKAAYWVDVYFGRSRPNTGTPCSCPGSSNNQCFVDSTNSCTNATNFGSNNRSYVGP